jgi:hypothetical protein
MEEGGDEVMHGGRDGVGYMLAYMVEDVVLSSRAGAGISLLHRAHGGSLWLGYLTRLKSGIRKGRTWKEEKRV